jgi:hypothetical protein
MPPGAVRLARHPRPRPPRGWMVRAAARAADPATRRGLLLLAGAALAAALFLFAPRERRDGPDG